MVVHGDGLPYAQPVDPKPAQLSITIACATVGERIAQRLGNCHGYNGASTRSLRPLLMASLFK